MSEIRFYHLTTRSLDQALPDILQKALSAGHRIVVRAADDVEVERLNTHLWTHRPDSFIPHGSKKDGKGPLQPIWLTACDDNPNHANVLIVTAGAVPESFEGITLFCDMFDGRDDAQLAAARDRWKIYKGSSEHTLTYWQQTEKGWEQKS